MASIAVEEAQSLKGNTLFHPSTVTPHDYPTFLRASVCRVVAGSMLLSGVFAAVCALMTTNASAQTSCALSAAVSFVALWHYSKLMAIREQTGTRLTLSKPGDVPMGQAVQLKIGWQDMAADAVRYSDWMVRSAPPYNTTRMRPFAMHTLCNILCLNSCRPLGLHGRSEPHFLSPYGTNDWNFGR